MSGNKRAKCPKCGYSAYERTGQDAEGFFTYFKCRKECGLVRPMPDGSFIGINYDDVHSHRGARKHKCPQCGLPSLGKCMHRGTSSSYATITCDVCGKFSSYNGAPWKLVGTPPRRGVSRAAIKPKPRLTVEKMLAEGPFAHANTDLKKAHKPKEKNWATDAVTKRAKPGPRSLTPEEELFNVYPGSMVRGNIGVKRRWEVDERLEQRRLEREFKEVWEE